MGQFSITVSSDRCSFDFFSEQKNEPSDVFMFLPSASYVTASYSTCIEFVLLKVVSLELRDTDPISSFLLDSSIYEEKCQLPNDV